MESVVIYFFPDEGETSKGVFIMNVGKRGMLWYVCMCVCVWLCVRLGVCACDPHHMKSPETKLNPEGAFNLWSCDSFQPITGFTLAFTVGTQQS